MIGLGALRLGCLVLGWLPGTEENTLNDPGSHTASKVLSDPPSHVHRAASHANAARFSTVSSSASSWGTGQGPSSVTRVRVPGGSWRIPYLVLRLLQMQHPFRKPQQRGAIFMQTYSRSREPISNPGPQDGFLMGWMVHKIIDDGYQGGLTAQMRAFENGAGLQDDRSIPKTGGYVSEFCHTKSSQGRTSSTATPHTQA